MEPLIRACLRLRVIVVLAAVLLLVLGIRLAAQTPVDVFPEFAPPTVEIQTEAPGLSSVEVERLIAVPLEAALAGTPWLVTMRTKSVLGLSSVVLHFDRSADLMAARQLVQERLARAALQLPALARPPVLMPPLSSTSRVLKIGVTSPTRSQMELTDLVRWTLRPRLMAVPGVANVAIWGQRDRQLQIRVDPERLRLHGVSLDEVLLAAGEATLQGPGGVVDTPNQRFAVTHITTVADPESLAEVVVALRGQTVLRLGDVAEIVEDHPPPIGDAIVNGGHGLLLVVEKQPWGNTLSVTRGVEAALESVAVGLPDVDLDPTIFRPATFIELAIDNLGRALLLGCVLVVLVLLAFLYNLRTAAISLVAIPVSLVAALAVLHAAGVMINTMVLAGLVIALGEVVDDAIIDVENILRRLTENRRAGSPKSAFAVVLSASLEVRSAVIYATAIVVLVFLPIVLLGGVAGAFFRPLALAYVLAVVASMVVAITLTPALALLLLPGSTGEGRESPLARGIRRFYAPALAPIMRRPRAVFIVLLLLFGGAAASVPALGEGFLPEFKERDFLMHWVAKPGTSLEAVSRTALRASAELRAIPGVRNFGAHIGRAEAADEVVGANFAELWISLDSTTDHAAALARINAVIARYPGLYRDVQTYLREKMKEVLTGTGGAIVIRLYGPEQDELQRQASAVVDALAEVEGITNLHVEPQVAVPQIQVRFRADAAQRFGLTQGAIRRVATTIVGGAKVGEVLRGERVLDVVVIGDEHLREDPSSLGAIRIATPLGGETTLGAVADVTVESSPGVILREGGSRKLDITCDVEGADLGEVAGKVEALTRGLPRPAGYHPEFIGEYAERQAAQRRLIGWSWVALLGIGAILFIDFRAPRPTLLVFTTLPFALVGGVAGVWLSGGVLTLGSLVGLITVLGIAARNGIMLVGHCRHLELAEGVPFGPGLVIRAATERVAPILMTALTTGLALIPLALGGDLPGQEIEHPMAIVILGGLITSTTLNLFFVPALYLRFGRPTSAEAGIQE